jgi:hypothetical protein
MLLTLIEPTEQADDDQRTFACWGYYRSYGAVQKIFKCCRRAVIPASSEWSVVRHVSFLIPQSPIDAELFDPPTVRNFGGVPCRVSLPSVQKPVEPGAAP